MSKFIFTIIIVFCLIVLFSSPSAKKRKKKGNNLRLAGPIKGDLADKDIELDADGESGKYRVESGEVPDLRSPISDPRKTINDKLCS